MTPRPSLPLARLAMLFPLFGLACDVGRTPAAPKPAPPAESPDAALASTAPSTSASAMPPSGMPPPRERCGRPTSLVQGRTHKPELRWDGEVLLENTSHLDPETLAPVPYSPAPPPPKAALLPREVQGDTLEKRGLAIVRVRKDGSTAWSAPIKTRESARSLEGDRWLVIDTGRGESDDPRYRVIDVESGAAVRGTYADVTEHYLGDFDNSGSGSGRVLDIASGKVVSQWDACVAGGTQVFSFSPRGRYFVCTGGRSGSSYRDLGRRGRDAPFGGFGVYLSPDESYAVDVPQDGGMVEVGSGDVAYINEDTNTSRVLGHARANSSGQEDVVAVAFCGEGQLFAVVLPAELGVYDGRSGQRLAHAPAMTGGDLAFDASGKYVMQSRRGASTIYRLEP